MRTRDIFVLSVVAAALVIVLVAIFTNLSGFHGFMGELHTGVTTVALGLWDGVIVLFIVGVVLGSAYVVIRLRQMSRFHAVGHTKHGPTQAIVLADGRVEHLNSGQVQMDPAQQLEMLRKAMQVLSANASMMKRFPVDDDVVDAEQTRQIGSGQTKQLGAPSASLPTNVLYEDIREQVPRGHILVGIGRSGIETKEKAVGACVWIVGLSGTGKTSTTVLRVEERHADGHKFLGVDPHWFKPDSLMNAVKGYSRSFLKPMARTPEQSKEVLNAFINEFNGRKIGQIPQPWQKITLLVDEVGALMDPTTPEEEEIKDLLPTIARICGQEARNFNMGGIFISQQATGLAWLRKMALMVIVHQLLMESEKKLACNGDTDVVEEMKTWPIGRTYVYGVGFQEGPRTVQQPYFVTPKEESPVTYPDGPSIDDDAIFLRSQVRNTGPISTVPTNDLNEPENTVPDGPIQMSPTLGPDDRCFSPEQETEFLRRYRKKPQAIKVILRQMNNGEGLSNRYAKHASWLLEREGLRG